MNNEPFQYANRVDLSLADKYFIMSFMKELDGESSLIDKFLLDYETFSKLIEIMNYKISEHKFNVANKDLEQDKETFFDGLQSANPVNNNSTPLDDNEFSYVPIKK